MQLVHSEAADAYAPLREEPTSDAVLWRFQTPVGFNHFANQFRVKPSNAEHFPLLAVLLKHEKKARAQARARAALSTRGAREPLPSQRRAGWPCAPRARGQLRLHVHHHRHVHLPAWGRV